MKRRKRRLNPVYWTFQYLLCIVAISSFFWIPYLIEKLYDYIASVPSQLHAVAVELVRFELS